MRLHVSDNISSTTLFRAMHYAQEKSNTGFLVVEFNRHGSRSAAHAFDVRLYGDGSVNKHWANTGTHGADRSYAAHWDAWGWFFSYLFAIDPNMHSWADKDAAAFHARTENRFVDSSFITTGRIAS